jgi:DNA polymerase I-like protein with 3'-5' exonuclease and polymerase domains
MSEILLFLGTEEDREYTPHLKPLVSNATVFTRFSPVSTLAEIVAYCKARNITGVISTNKDILMRLLAQMGNHKKSVSLDDYQGSYFQHQGIEFVFLSPLKQLFTVSYGKFIARRFISKLAAPQEWSKSPSFTWEVLTASNQEKIFKQFESAIMIGVDIETLRDNLRIDSISYTALFVDSNGTLSTHTAVLSIESMYDVTIMRKFNWQLQAPKVFQNGKYDLAYLSRYAAVPYNYLWDTATMFHCWYAELPKDLGFLGAFFVREGVYWKDLAQSPDRKEQLRYNALDTYTTVLVAMQWIIQSPEWAKRNYRAEFPLNFPCHLSEMTGIKRDMPMLLKAEEVVDSQIAEANKRLDRMLGIPAGLTFNTNSAPQNQRLRKVLGCSHIESSDEKNVKKMSLMHPLNGAIFSVYGKIKKWRKLSSTYLTPGKELNGRILYAINPHGTDTGRMASREHHFWCGLQVQNIPRGKEVKVTLVADEGFRLGECDLKQAETRDTAYVSGDANLIAAVNSPKDFHALNASAFFGVPYESIFDDETAKTLDKALRDLSKRVNHGANYLMGWGVLIDTMGEDKVWEAKKLLCLPRSYGLRDVAEHLLTVFHQTYPTLQAQYYPAVVNEVVTTKMLVSHARIQEPLVYGIEPTFDPNWELVPDNELAGWTRYCFGDPLKNKSDKNAYVAHVSQSLNAQVLNRAYLRVFYEIALNPKYSSVFKLCAQIHDSILFQFKEGHEYLADMVCKLMEVPVRILGYDGVVRTFAVPADAKIGKDNKGALRWSETE